MHRVISKKKARFDVVVALLGVLVGAGFTVFCGLATHDIAVTHPVCTWGDAHSPGWNSAECEFLRGPFALMLGGTIGGVLLAGLMLYHALSIVRARL